jgi:adenylosuccinate lyase
VVSATSSKTGLRIRPDERWLPVRALGFSLIWALLISGLVMIQLALSYQGVTSRTVAVVILFAFGSFAGALFARALEMVDTYLVAESKFRIWFEIEAHACDAQAELPGVIPKEAAKTIWDKGGKATFDIDRIDEIERETKHDVIAFLTHLAEIVGPEARFVHQGMTSSDVLDTCLNVQLVKATDILLADMDALLAAIKRRAFEHKDTVCIGRSHGIHAEPVTFGLKLAEAYAEFDRCRTRLRQCPRGNRHLRHLRRRRHLRQHRSARRRTCGQGHGPDAEPVSTQVIPRDRHAMYFATLGVIASSIERVATEIRHLQRTEVLEAEEYFSRARKARRRCRTSATRC